MVMKKLGNTEADLKTLLIKTASVTLFFLTPK